MTEDELLAKALQLSREEHAREQEMRAMAAAAIPSPLACFSPSPPPPPPRQQQQQQAAPSSVARSVVGVRALEAQMQAAGFGYEVEYGSDDDLPTVASTAPAHSAHSTPTPRQQQQAPAPAFSAASSLFSGPSPVASSALGPIRPPPISSRPPQAIAPPVPVPMPVPVPIMPGLEPGYGDDDDVDDEDDDEPPTDLTCPIKFMLLLDPGQLPCLGVALLGGGGRVGASLIGRID